MAKKEIKFKHGIEFVPINNLKPIDVNPNYVSPELQQSIEDDISKNGFYGAIIVDKNYNIVDGEHRWRALKKLGLKECPVIMDKELTEVTRKIQTVRLNREHGYLTPIETGTLLQQLSKEVPNDILAKMVNMPAVEMNLLMNLHYDPKLDTERLKSSSVSWADVEKFSTKIANQLKNKEIDCIVAVNRGGLIPARLIADKLNVKRITIHNAWDKIKVPNNTIIVDDIYDSGKTYKEIMESNKSYKECIFATLLLRVGKKAPENLVYAVVTEDNSYINFPWEKMELKKSLKSK